jgi:predicted Zn-dependent peptidase
VHGERRVVQEELRLAAADPTDIVHDLFFGIAYGDHPIGRPVGGTVAGVAELGPDDVVQWSASHVRPETLAVVVCGGLTQDQVGDALAGSALASFEGTPQQRPADSSPPVRAGRQFLPVVADTAAVVVGGQGFALADPMICPAEIVVELLAGANSSVLNEEIRSRRGLSYDVWGALAGYRETGTWRVAISTAPEQREFVADLAIELVTGASAKGWTEQEVDAARRRAAGLLRVSAESCIEEALVHGDHVFVGEASEYSLRAHAAGLAQTSAAEVNHAAEVMTERLVVATAGGD